MKKKNLIKYVILLVGCSLLFMNIIGLFIPLRNSAIYQEENTYFENDIIYTQKELNDLLKRKNESDKVFIERATMAIFNGIAHYWKDEGIEKYNLRIPIEENYLLFLASYVYPAKYRKYEFNDYKRGIERGVGLCSQHAIILSTVLEKNGIDTRIINMPCHVVVMAEADRELKEWWVTDADYGVIIPNGIEELKNDLQLVSSHYKAKGFSNEVINDVLECYSNVLKIDKNALDYSGVKWYYIEKSSYVLKWLIPISFLFIFYRIRKI